MALAPVLYSQAMTEAYNDNFVAYSTLVSQIPKINNRTRDYFESCFIGTDMETDKKVIFISNIKRPIKELKFNISYTTNFKPVLPRRAVYTKVLIFQKLKIR